MKLPTIKELAEIIKPIKPRILDEYVQEEDTLPSIQITVGWNPETGEWDYQTGDNGYSGAAYFYPVWAVGSVYRRTNSRALARDLIAQLDEGTW